MKPCISEATTLSATFAEDVAAYSDTGWPAMEVWLTKLETHLQSHSVRATKDLLAEKKIALAAASYQGGLLLSQGEARRAHFDHFKRRLMLCQEFDIPTMLVVADFVQNVDATSLERSVVSLKQAAQWAAGFNVRLALEFHGSDTFCSCLETALILVEQCGEANVGVNLDLFHYYKGASKPEDLELLTPGNLAFVQLSDVAGVPRELATDADRIMPGDGDFRIEAILDSVKKIGYNDYVSLELMNPVLWQAKPTQVAELGLGGPPTVCSYLMSGRKRSHHLKFETAHSAAAGKRMPARDRSARNTALSEEPPSANSSLPAAQTSLKAPFMGDTSLGRRTKRSPLAGREEFSSRQAREAHSIGRIDTANRAEYLGALQDWNARLTEHLRFIRILESVRWSDKVEHNFFAGGCRELPQISLADYRQSIPFSNLPDRLADLRRLERDIAQRLGPGSPAARLLMRHSRSAQDAIRLIAARGTREFVWLSREIYGTSQTSKTSRERLLRLIANFESTADDTVEIGWMSADAAVAELSRRLHDYFGENLVDVRVVTSLNADACAGCGYLKLRRGAVFARADIELLEVHEGWVHLGTMLNGQRQPLFTSLARSTPCTTATQEGLAIFMELLAGFCHPQRRRKLARRLRAVMMAEEGADFLQVFSYFRERGVGEREAYRQTARVFRGSLASGLGPFTKDLAYGIGLLDLVAHLRSLKDEDGQTIPLLFAGKTCLDDIPDLAEIHEVGLLAPGELIPSPFRDRRRVRALLRDLAAW